MVIEEEDYSCA